MNKIDFKNKGEANAVPINADNLNLLQDNAEKSINEITNLLNDLKTITFTNQWFNVSYANGSGIRFIIPVFNPSNEAPDFEFELCRFFINGEWKEIASSNVGLYKYQKTFISLYVSGTDGLGLEIGKSYLIQLKGTITCK